MVHKLNISDSYPLYFCIQTLNQYVTKIHTLILTDTYISYKCLFLVNYQSLFAIINEFI